MLDYFRNGGDLSSADLDAQARLKMLLILHCMRLMRLPPEEAPLRVRNVFESLESANNL